MIVLPNGAVIPDQAMANARATDETNLRNRQLVNQMAMEQMRDKRALQDMQARERLSNLQREATERMATARLAEVAHDREARERIEGGRQGVDRERIAAGERTATAGRDAANNQALMHIMGQAWLNSQVSPRERAAALDLLDRYQKQQAVASRAKAVFTPENWARSVKSYALGQGVTEQSEPEEQAKAIKAAVKQLQEKYAKKYGEVVDFSEAQVNPATLAEIDTFYQTNPVPMQVLDVETPKIVSTIAGADTSVDLPKLAGTFRNIIGNQHVADAKKLAGHPAEAGPSLPKVSSGGGGYSDDYIYGGGGEVTADGGGAPAGEAPAGGGGEADGEQPTYPDDFMTVDQVLGPVQEEPLMHEGGVAPSVVSNIQKATAPWTPPTWGAGTTFNPITGANIQTGWPFRPPVYVPTPTPGNKYKGPSEIDESQEAATHAKTAGGRKNDAG